MAKYNIEGKVFDTMNEIIETYSISKQAIYGRINHPSKYRDWFIDKDNTGILAYADIFPFKLKINNTTFNTYRDVAETLGLDFASRNEKLVEIFNDPTMPNWTIEERLPIYEYPNRKYWYDGESYTNLGSLSRKLGLSISDLRARVDDPTDTSVKEEMIPMPKNEKMLIVVEGKLYRGTSSAAKAAGIFVSGAVKRIASDHYPDWVIVGYVPLKNTTEESVRLLLGEDHNAKQVIVKRGEACKPHIDLSSKENINALAERLIS